MVGSRSFQRFRKRWKLVKQRGHGCGESDTAGIATVTTKKSQQSSTRIHDACYCQFRALPVELAEIHHSWHGYQWVDANTSLGFFKSVRLYIYNVAR
jgi:hypothetical protein